MDCPESESNLAIVSPPIARALPAVDAKAAITGIAAATAEEAEAATAVAAIITPPEQNALSDNATTASTFLG